MVGMYLPLQLEQFHLHVVIPVRAERSRFSGEVEARHNHAVAGLLTVPQTA